MPQQTNNLRDRLLATLPHPENLAAYREETTSLLAKHHRALRWDYISIYAIFLAGCVLWFLWSGNHWHLIPGTLHFFQFASVAAFILAVISDVRYRIYKSQIDTLKEIRQVQLQILELQASVQKEQ